MFPVAHSIIKDISMGEIKLKNTYFINNGSLYLFLDINAWKVIYRLNSYTANNLMHSQKLS